MKKTKSNLDERQELTLLQIEHNGCWLAFWGLLLALSVQLILGNNSIGALAGEWAVFMFLALYLMIACIRNGIWDRKWKPNFKTNLLFQQHRRPVGRDHLGRCFLPELPSPCRFPGSRTFYVPDHGKPVPAGLDPFRQALSKKIAPAGRRRIVPMAPFPQYKIGAAKTLRRNFMRNPPNRR